MPETFDSQPSLRLSNHFFDPIRQPAPVPHPKIQRLADRILQAMNLDQLLSLERLNRMSGQDGKTESLADRLKDQADLVGVTSSRLSSATGWQLTDSVVGALVMNPMSISLAAMADSTLTFGANR